MTIIRLNPSGATFATLVRRFFYGGRKGRAAMRRLRRRGAVRVRGVSNKVIGFTVPR